MPRFIDIRKRCEVRLVNCTQGGHRAACTIIGDTRAGGYGATEEEALANLKRDLNAHGFEAVLVDFDDFGPPGRSRDRAIARELGRDE